MIARAKREWLGEPPTEQDLELWNWWLFENVASRPPESAKHQRCLVRGNFTVYYPDQARRKRGSDIWRRKFSAVYMRQLAGQTNFEACKEVGFYLLDRSHSRTQGRPRTSGKENDLLREAQRVRTAFNQYKSRHRGSESDPNWWSELRCWWWSFLYFKAWAMKNYQEDLRESATNCHTVLEWCKERRRRYGRAMLAPRDIERLTHEFSLGYQSTTQ